MVEAIQIAAWRQYSWLRHGFSTRLGGVSTVYGGQALNLGYTKEDDPASVAENRRRLVQSLGGTGNPVTLRQVHGTLIHAIPNTTPLLEGDGLATGTPGQLLGILTADCVPVMLVDPKLRAVAVLHAGWRGTVAGMAGQGVTAMRHHYGSRPEDLLAAVGPSICPCCYTVGDEVRTAFTARYPYADALFAESRLNLWEANRRQLITAGIAAASIEIVGDCTGCSRTASGQRRYFSHRIDHGVTGRMMSLIGIANG